MACRHLTGGAIPALVFFAAVALVVMAAPVRPIQHAEKRQHATGHLELVWSCGHGSGFPGGSPGAARLHRSPSDGRPVQRGQRRGLWQRVEPGCYKLLQRARAGAAGQRNQDEVVDCRDATVARERLLRRVRHAAPAGEGHRPFGVPACGTTTAGPARRRWRCRPARCRWVSLGPPRGRRLRRRRGRAR